MSYAVRKDGKGWRTVESINDIASDETFSTEIPQESWSPNVILARVRDARIYPLNALVGLVIAEREKSVPDELFIKGCLQARQNLLDITSLPSVKSATNEEELKAVLLSEYEALVAKVPTNIREAFSSFRL